MRSRAATNQIVLPLQSTLVYVTRATNQVISYVGGTYIIFPTIYEDRGSEYNSTTGVFTTKNPGYYLACASSGSNPFVTPAGFYWITSIHKNSSAVLSALSCTGVNSSSNEYGVANVRGVVKLDKGDTLSVRVGHNYTANLNTLAGNERYMYFQISMLSRQL